MKQSITEGAEFQQYRKSDSKYTDINKNKNYDIWSFHRTLAEKNHRNQIR